MFHQSAISLAREIKSGRLSPLEVIQAHLARIEETQPRINAAVEVLAEQALAAARTVTDGPLMGVPISIKDSIDVAGVKTTSGTITRRNAPPATHDATLVKRLRQAGAIPIAKTNLPDLLFSFETDNHIYGRTNNPYDLTRTPGGSSGGESALLASGGSALGLGSDAFGSVRLPAAFCGIATIKPTSGRLPRTGHVPGPAGWVQAVWQIGPMARHVEDVMLAMRLLAYPDEEDFSSPPVPLLESKQELKDLRVAFYTDNGFAACAPEIKAAVEKCARFLADEGAIVTNERAPGVADVFDLEMALFGNLESSDQAHPLQINFLSHLQPFTEKRYAQWDEYRAGLAKFFTRQDVILCPVYTQTALKHGASTQSENFYGFSYTMAWNVGQTPAATVRCAQSEGLPINVQVVTKPWNDMLALRVCAAIEQKFGGYQVP